MADPQAAGTNGEAIHGETKKLRRITRACDYCHKRSIRCKYPGLKDPTRCQNCIDFDQPCRFDRTVRRRGAKPRSQTLISTGGPSTLTGMETDDRESSASASIISPNTLDWKAPRVATEANVLELVEVYFEIIYPIFPFFHKPTFTQRIGQGEHLRDRFSFAATMALCALVSARIRDKAMYNPRWNTTKLLQVESEVFYTSAAMECANASATQQVELNLLRACALLAVTAIQYGRLREFQTYMGKYHVLVAMDRLHDEDNWPKNLGIVELEERRRLFWSMYSLDIYSSAVWNDVIRCREQQSSVSYPSELDDEFFDDGGYWWESSSTSGSPVDAASSPIHPFVDIRSSSWLCGWNFVTDLYRVMEHVITNFRDRRRHQQSFLVEIFGNQPLVSTSSVTESIATMYDNLPSYYKEAQAVSCDTKRDRYGFQAAFIAVTIQLLKVILMSSDEVQIEEQCKVVSELVSAFMRIPVQYLQAISIPVCHQLECIGTILVSANEGPIAESSYLQVRQVLLAVAQFLDRLNIGKHCATSAERIRNNLLHLDIKIDNQRRENIVSFNAASTNVNAARASSLYGSRGVIADLSHQNPSILQGNTNGLFEEWPRSFDYMHYSEA